MRATPALLKNVLVEAVAAISERCALPDLPHATVGSRRNGSKTDSNVSLLSRKRRITTSMVPVVVVNFI